VKTAGRTESQTKPEEVNQRGQIRIRPVLESDAAGFLALRTQLDGESRFMMLEPGERDQDLEQQRAHLRSVLARDNDMIWVAVSEDEQLAGYLEAEGGRFRRNRHVATIVVGVLQVHQEQGIGSRLFQALESWAAEAGIQRLELTVMVHNEAAHTLYEKMGFTVEGRRHRSLRVDGEFVDEFSMAKLLP
jgi:RimJ/RimL family protein N-acetyltransferase